MTTNREEKKLVVFGYGLVVILLLLSLRLWFKHGMMVVHWVFIPVAITFFWLTKWQRDKLKPIYTYWMRAAHFLGTVMTMVVLFIVYFFLFGAFGIFFRLIKKDLLDRKIEPQRNSYWIKREVTPFDKKRYTRQF